MAGVTRAGTAHYVAHNAVTRIPRTYLYVDSEAYQATNGRRSTQTFRCAVAAADRWRHDARAYAPREWGEFLSPADLWAWVDAHTTAKGRTVLVAHNLAYDLRITDAFTALPALGWRLKAVRLDGGQAWATWARAGRTLAMVDSLSWVPVNLEKLGAVVGIQKLDLPDWADDDAAWLARCRRDVEILGDVWRRLMRWVESDDLGNWKPTGAGQAWAAFRHRFMTHGLLVHDNDEARDAERTAAHAGRCEAYRHGELAGNVWVEHDYRAAYAAIGRTQAVPVKLVGESSATTFDDVWRLGMKYAVLCEVEVTTSTPALPCRHDGRILWPVGTFVTTVWHHELELAAEYGAHIRVRRAWLYRTAPALRQFCDWVLDGMDERNAAVDPVVRIALKHWSRALIGRTAARWSTWERWGRSPISDVGLGKAYDASTGERFRLLQVGHDLIRNVDVKENPDAMVAIMSFVMASSRVKLWRAMETAGFDNVAYCDTDALIVNAAGDERLRRARIDGLRVKAAWQRVEVLGPRQLILSGQLKAAGVPRGSVRIDTRRWQGTVWSALTTSLASGEPAAVTLTDRQFTVAGVDRRRVVEPDGSTRPFVLCELGGPTETATT